MEKFARKYTNIGTDNHPVWELLPDECEPAETGPVKPLIFKFKKGYKKRGTDSNPIFQRPRTTCPDTSIVDIGDIDTGSGDTGGTSTLTIEDLRDWYPSCPLPLLSYTVFDSPLFQGAGKQSSATFYAWVNHPSVTNEITEIEKYSYASSTQVDQNNGEYTDDSSGYYGHTIASANQSMAWTFIPDGIKNKTSDMIGFAMGWDGPSYNYHIVTVSLEYADLLGNQSDWVLVPGSQYNSGYTYYHLSSTGTPPLGWIAPEYATLDGSYTRQPSCRTDDTGIVFDKGVRL